VRRTLLFAPCFLPMIAVAQPPEKDAPPTVEVSVTNTEETPVPVSDQTLVEWRFIDFSDTETNGQIQSGVNLLGYPAMHAICAAEVPGSRACFSSEVARSTRPDDTTSGWVIPTDVVVYPVPIDRWLAHDTAIGRTGVSEQFPSDAMFDLSCANYINGSSGNGSIFSRLGVTTGAMASCTTLRPIACCGPVAIPVTTAP
jgi:hypothetical protein